MATRLIPAGEAVLHLADARLRADLQAMFVIQNEAMALLVGHLHRSGLVDGMALAEHLQAQLNNPEVLAETPRVAALAELLVGRLAFEVQDPEAPSDAAPPAPD